MKVGKMPFMSDFPDEAVSFEIIDADTGNTVASFAEMGAAEACVRSILDADVKQAEELVLVAFDKAGNAVGTEMAGQMLVW
jgi:hypothetical protein